VGSAYSTLSKTIDIVQVVLRDTLYRSFSRATDMAKKELAIDANR